MEDKGGKVIFLFYNQYKSKQVQLGEINLSTSLRGQKGPPRVVGDIDPLTA